jgi:tetratricopeptide (TPR) repeat protein
MRTAVTRARETQYEGKAEAIEESTYLLAKCYCRLDALESAQATLLELLNDSTRTALQVAEMGHSLAEVYLLQEDYDSAEKSCRDAITKKSQLLSRNHESVYSSICLLVQILEGKGLSHIAIGYKSLLPPTMGTSQYR